MNLRPIKDRILIRPDVQPNTTESGLILAEHKKPELTGTVVAVGPCAHPLQAEAEEVAQELAERVGYGKHPYDDWMEQLPDVRAIKLLRRATSRTPQVKVGDYVVFSWTSGQEITIEDERYLMMREDDIMAVIEGIEA